MNIYNSKKNNICLPIILLIFFIPGILFAEDIDNVALIEDTDGTIHDTFTAAMPNVYLSKISCIFYLDHPDEYDALFVFDNEMLGMANVQQGWPVGTPPAGIGRENWPEQTNAFCSSTNHRLRQVVKMGSISSASGLPDNPDDNAPIVIFYPLTGIELMGHEFGHQWLATINYQRENDEEQQCLLRGYEPSGSEKSGDKDEEICKDYNNHWSLNFNSCSLMYGSCIKDQGDGNFQYSYPSNKIKFSQLDQYLMGIRPKDEVDPMFLVDVGSEGNPSLPLGHGTTSNVTGTRVDFTIDDVIRAMGERIPAKDICHWKAAFMITYLPENPPTQAVIDKVNRYRLRWEAFYDWATDNRGSFDTSLDGCGTGTQTCVGEQSSQCGAAADGDEDSCLMGETKCGSLTEVKICNQEHKWETLTTCKLDEICEDGECISADTDGDIVDPDGDLISVDGDKDSIADGDQPVISDGDWQATDGDSPNGNTPDEPCSPKQTRCVNGIFQECNFTGDWQSIQNCTASNQTCNPTSGCDDGSGNGDSGCKSSKMPAGFLLVLLLMFIVRKRKHISY